MYSFNDKVVVISGAASGIGLEISKQYLAEGAYVVGSDINADALANIAEEMGERFTGVQSDAGKVSDIKALMELVEAKYGRIDILVNNAGLGGEQTPETIEEPEYDLLMNVMLKGPVFHVKYAARLLREAEDGNVINISSGSSRMSLPAYMPYAITKAGMEKFTEDCVIQTPGIRHNCVLPGFIDTPILSTGYSEEKIKEIKEAFPKMVPCRRMGRPADIANMVLFLSSNKTTYVNGSCVIVDGGLARLNKMN